MKSTEDPIKLSSTVPELTRALKASEDRYRALLTNLPGSAAFIVDQHLRYVVADGEALYAVGMKPSDFEGKSLFDVLEPAQAADYKVHLYQALEGTPFFHEHKIHGRFFQSRGVPLRDPSGHVYAVLVVSYDITERKRAEEALHASEEHYRAIVNQNVAGIVEIDLVGNFVFVNRQFVEKFGYASRQLLRMNVSDLTCPEDLSRCINQLEQMKIDCLPFEIEKRLMHADGSLIWVHYSVSPIIGADGRPHTAVIILIDISKRKESEQALRQSNELLEVRVAERTAELARMNGIRQDLLQRLVTAQEQERRRISHELHDQTGQHLTGLALGLKSLEKSIEAYCPAETGAGRLLEQLRGITAEMAMDVHRIAVELRPTALDDLGLVPALRSHVQRWSAGNGIAAEFDCFGHSASDSGTYRLPDTVETTVYRVVQEALTNVARHAGQGPDRATRVGVTLQRFAGHLQAIVEDNGPGFNVEAAKNLGRLGLAGMQERAISCNGTLQIESAPGQGTGIFLRIPIPTSPEQ